MSNRSSLTSLEREGLQVMLGGGPCLQAREISPRSCENWKTGSWKSDVETDHLLTPVERQETSRDGH